MGIKLNFFPLSNQDIVFKVYRQEFQQQPKQPGYYKAKLPQVEGSDIDYKEFWTTFDKAEGFEPFSCTKKDNIYLTLGLIWEVFLKNIKAKLPAATYILHDKKYDKSVSLIISESPEGKEVINVEPYYLRSASKFGFIVDFRFKRNGDIPFSRKIQQLSLSLDKNFYSNRNYYSDKYDKLNIFVEKFLGILFPLTIDGQEYYLEKSLQSLATQLLAPKIYLFKNRKESKSQFNGLKEYGPHVPMEIVPLLIFIFQDNQRELANEVFNALVGKSFPLTFPGMENFFGVKIANENITKINIKSFSKDDMKSVHDELESIITNNPNRRLLGIFIEHSKEFSTDTTFSPYYYLKYIFTVKQIPMQAITIERIRGRDGLKWSASGIGLQIFAKLGGIPWIVKPSNDKCIIFGLGSAHQKDEHDVILKYFAYSVCFDSSGIYKKIDVLGASSNKEDYIKELENNIKSVLSEYLNRNADVEKCAIHLPFKIKGDEIESIRKSVSTIASDKPKIEFQFIKINTDNKFFGYAENNSKVPYESSYVKLSRDEYLIWFEGLQFGKEVVNKRIGNPVHIQFMKDANLDDEDRKKYLQDVINLSGANWRGFNAKLAPISIYYPEIIAKYISEFRKYDGDTMNIANLGIPWFL